MMIRMMMMKTMTTMIKINWSVWQERLLLIRVLVRRNAAVYHCLQPHPPHHHHHYHHYHDKTQPMGFVIMTNFSSCFWDPFPNAESLVCSDEESNLIYHVQVPQHRVLLHADLGTLEPLCSQQQ